LNSAVDKLSEAAMGRFMTESVSLLGSPDKVIAYMQGERQIKIKEKEAADKGEYYKGYADYLRSGGKSKSDTLKARAEEYAELLVESQEINPKTNKPYTPAEAKKQALGLVLKSPDTRNIEVKEGYVIQNGQLFIPDPKIPGKFIPATGLPGAGNNSTYDTMKNAPGPGKRTTPVNARAQLFPKAIPDDTDTDRNISSAIMP